MATRQDYTSGTPPAQVGSIAVGTPNVNQPQPQTPFRVATMERADLVQVDAQAMTTVEQILERVLPGTGYLYGIDLDYAAAAAGNGANVAYTEDGAYAAASSVIWRDVNAELGNSDGFSLKQAARYGGWEPFNEETSTDTLVFSKATGSGSTGGTFRFHLKIPVALTRRTLLGLQGNQDRSQSYIIRANLAGSGAVYSVAPTNQPTVTINRHYESYVVPNPINDLGRPQAVYPPFFGVIPYITKSINPNAPTGGQTTNHFLQRINTTFRLLLLILRSNNSRATAESNLPTNIQLRIGSQSIFNELPAYRRRLMFDRYGFDAPSGCLAYDFLHDFSQFAGAELGNDWWWTQNLTEAQFTVTYPSGFGSTNNSLVIVTADMTVPAGMQLQAQ
jgi:hypothetical protein